ncbi:uncharacterized protein LOC122290772 [Carya illinoinensis]|uniref:uncharacterized protein LOC122290772 n=1 Tax=Carya illinoinensis TaxID=32201 RepID=UPI001C71DA31|nr:uncharacterized protein LOC122290772 [Carya illinoinensis]
MTSWTRDHTSRLFRTESLTFFSSASSSVESSSDTDSVMAENENHDREMGNPNRTLRDYLQPVRTSTPSCIIQPLDANNFNFKPEMIPLIPHFHGMDSENPYLHIKEFEEVCSTFMDRTCTKEVIRLKLFPLSLKDKAKTWLNSLRPRTIRTWQEMQAGFLKKFFPIQRTNALKRQIMNFSQKDSETFYQCWERFKDLLDSCPHHGYEHWRVISFFYESLTPKMHQFVQTMCNGNFFDKEPEETFEYFDYLAGNAQTWDTTDVHDRSRQVESSHRKHTLNEDDDLRAKLTLLPRKVEAVELKKVNEVHAVPKFSEKGDICEDRGHSTDEYPTIPAFKEVLLDQSNDSGPYTNSYDPGWRSHPNLSWRGDQHVTSATLAPEPSQLAIQAPPMQKKGFEDTVQQLSTQEEGKFPAQSQPNPQGQPHQVQAISEDPTLKSVKAVTTLRSGKVVDIPAHEPYNSDSSIPLQETK